MNIKKPIIIILSFISILFACTSFVLQRDSLHYLAKNLDWEIDRGYLYYNLDGIKKTSISDPEFVWISKYKSITNNQFGKEFPLGGMNEKGLVIEEMSLFGQSYALDESKRQLNEFQWIQYQLDMSMTVEDVIKSLESITIKHDMMNLHYLILDQRGDAAVIECLDGGIVVYRGDTLPHRVLSNNPYEKALRYLGFFKGYGGDMEILHRPGSQERFVSAVWLLDQTQHEAPIDQAFNILETVRQSDTRWQFVFDPLELKIICKTHNNPENFIIGFSDLEKIKHNRWAVSLFDGTRQKIKMNPKKNQEQLSYIHKKLKENFPDRDLQFLKMMEEGERSLKQK